MKELVAPLLYTCHDTDALSLSYEFILILLVVSLVSLILDEVVPCTCHEHVRCILTIADHWINSLNIGCQTISILQNQKTNPMIVHDEW